MRNLKGSAEGGPGVADRGPGPLAPSPQTPFTAAILAGGLSRRLGRDKAGLILGGRPLACRVAEALAPLARETWLITNHPALHLPLGLPLLTDLRPFQGPLGGLATAMFYAATPWVLLAAADAPFLQPVLVAAMLAQAGPRVRAVGCCTSRGVAPLPSLYSVKLLGSLQEFLKTERKVGRFLELCRPQLLPPEEVARLDPEGLSFLNINTPEELAGARSWLEKKEKTLTLAP